MLHLRLVCLSLALLTLSACGLSRQVVPEHGYSAPLGREHALIGKIWSSEEREFIRVRQLEKKLARARIVLIGESHDNVDHHRLEAWLLARFLAAHEQSSPHVAFEMLDEQQAPALLPPPASAEQLAERVRWDETGWPPFALYQPVFELTLRERATIVAAHPARERVRASMRGVEAAEAKELGLDEPLPPREREELAEEIRRSHCGHASGAMVEGMSRAQSYKDAFMARALRKTEAPSALIAGRGHVIAERGVPLFLARSSVHDVLTVALLEASDERVHAEDYDPERYDIVIFTPRMSDADACEAFREQLERMKRAHGAEGAQTRR